MYHYSIHFPAAHNIYYALSHSLIMIISIPIGKTFLCRTYCGKIISTNIILVKSISMSLTLFGSDPTNIPATSIVRTAYTIASLDLLTHMSS